MFDKTWTNIEIKKLANSEIEISGEINSEALNTARARALKKIAANLEIDGFRRGKVPEEVALKKVGEVTVLEAAAEQALGKAYSEIITENQLEVIGEPKVSITKLAPNNPLGFKFNVALMPALELPDYQKIATSVMSRPVDKVVVSQVEIDQVILQVRRNKAHHDQHEKLTPEEVAEHQHREIKDEDLPEVNDEFAQAVGSFKDVADFKQKVEENLKREMEIKAKEKRRLEVVEELVSQTKGEIPNILIESEIAKMLGQFKDEVARANVKFEDYLVQIKKTEEDLRQEWRVTAEKKSRLQLILNKISITENITAPKELLENEIKQLTEYYKDADPLRIRAYVENLIVNEEVFKWLEKQGELG